MLALHHELFRNKGEGLLQPAMVHVVLVSHCRQPTLLFPSKEMRTKETWGWEFNAFLHAMVCIHSYKRGSSSFPTLNGMCSLLQSYLVWQHTECDMVPNFEDVWVAPTQKMALGFWQQDKINSNKMQMSTYLVMFSFTSSLGYVVC